jgi:two-component system alkaline phosphatase synthesis response regulator PhoP
MIYLVEDDGNIRELVVYALQSTGMACEGFARPSEFWKRVKEQVPSLVLLDIMLPDGSGLDVLKESKTYYPTISCIILSALGMEIDKVTGLDLGADDYIAKPFGVMELIARVKAVLRRTASGETLKVGDLELDVRAMSVTLKGEKLDLNKKEFELLRYCMKNVDVVLPRDVLLTEVWGYVDSETRTLDNHIARLRKIGINNFETVFGVGYRFKKE